MRRRARITGSSDRNAHGRALIARSGLFDKEWVEAQLSREFATPEEAIDAYLAGPAALSPHPLFVPQWINTRRQPGPGEDPLVWYLTTPEVNSHATPHPLVDPKAIVAADAAAAEHDLGPVAAWAATLTPESVLPSSSGTPSLTWSEARTVSFSALRDHQHHLALRNAPRVSKEPPAEPEIPAGALHGEEGRPLVSIVMPMWNRAHSVRSAIESVQAQSHTDWELIVVDDGSEDDSAAVVDGIGAFDPRVVCVRAVHGGVSAARNTAVERARGRYLAFLDTDNTWHPDFLRVMLASLERHGWEMAHGTLRSTNEDRVYYRAFEGTHDHLLVGNHVDLNVLVARTELVRRVGGFDTRLRRGVDYDLILKLARETDLHLVPFVGVDYRDDAMGHARISTTESLDWLQYILSEHAVDWAAEAERPRRPGRTSVVMCSQPFLRHSLPAIRAYAGQGDCQLVVVSLRLPEWRHILLETVVASVGGLVVTVDAQQARKAALNIAASRGSGEFVVLALGDAVPDPDQARRLVESLSDPAVAASQPAVLDERDVVAAAGADFATSRCIPSPFLHEHPTSDLPGSDEMTVPGIYGPVFAVRAEEFCRLHGVDSLYNPWLVGTDLALRAGDRGVPREVRLVPDVRLVEREFPLETHDLESLRLLDQRHPFAPGGSETAWRSVGLDPVGVRNTVVAPPAAAEPEDEEGAPPPFPTPEDRPFLLPKTVLRGGGRLTVEEPRPSLRWTIDLASPPGRRGAGWGDTSYGTALANALRRLGQRVAVDSRAARHRSTRDLDDVVLVLRGLDRVEPRPGALNMEWIISHPDLVTPEEIAGFDLVYAASVAWPRQVRSAWGLEIKPLLQATDPTLFNPERAPFDSGDEVLFVGNSRGVYRDSVRFAVQAGIDLTLHGADWERFVPAGLLTSRLVSNSELGALYASAGVVLNDHWQDMRDWGFVSNRLMDAAASGARVVSDAVPGTDLTEMFSGLVQTWSDYEDFVRLIEKRDSVFPPEEERVRAAHRVAAEHSFDSRAERLIDDALTVLRTRG